MSAHQEIVSRSLLKRLQETLATSVAGQERLDHITRIIADSMHTEVCSIYLLTDQNTLELCATFGLRTEAVHVSRLRVGHGLVGKIASRGKPINTENAPQESGFHYMPETGEEIYQSFLGIPIQRLGQITGVLVVQTKATRKYTDDDIYALEITAMVLAEMAELGAFVEGNDTISPQHQYPVSFSAVVGQEGLAIGNVLLHEPRVIITRYFADDPHQESKRLEKAVNKLRSSVNAMLSEIPEQSSNSESIEVFNVYRMLAHSQSWLARMQDSIIRGGLSAESAVEKEQTSALSRMQKVTDLYLRERLHDFDDLSNRLLRLLTGQDQNAAVDTIDDPILVARNIGPAELLDYGTRLKGVVLEGGSVGSHATIVARSFAIPLLIDAQGVIAEAVNGDRIIINADPEQTRVHVRPDATLYATFRDKLDMQAKSQETYKEIRNKPTLSLCGKRIHLNMNAGLMSDFDMFKQSGAEGIGLFRTELQFLLRNTLPARSELKIMYEQVFSAANDRPIVFRTLDIGSDKVLPYLNATVDEPNPALGWRAIRLTLDRPAVMRMQLQALLRAAKGRRLAVMFPFIAQFNEFIQARDCLLRQVEAEQKLGYTIPEQLSIGAMLETPSLGFSPKQFYDMADFISIGGNDLKQFFFAADRENELVRRRYDVLNVSFLTFIENVIQRCRESNTPLSFCGEDAGRPIEAVCLAAMGLRSLSMRASSIGPVKYLLLKTNLDEALAVINYARQKGVQSVRSTVKEWLSTLAP